MVGITALDGLAKRSRLKLKFHSGRAGWTMKIPAQPFLDWDFRFWRVGWANLRASAGRHLNLGINGDDSHGRRRLKPGNVRMHSPYVAGENGRGTTDARAREGDRPSREKTEQLGRISTRARRLWELLPYRRRLKW